MGTVAGPENRPVYSWANGWSPGIKGGDPIVDADGVVIAFPTYDEAIAWYDPAPPDNTTVSGTVLTIAEEARQILDVEHAVYPQTDAVIDAMAAEYAVGFMAHIGPVSELPHNEAARAIADAYLVLIHARSAAQA
jgi:hypothetical protein